MLRKPIISRRRKSTEISPVSICLESHVEQAITDLLEWDGWRVFKMEQNFSERKLKQTGEPSMPDRLCIRYATPVNGQGTGLASVLWIETKRNGRKPTANQFAWHEAERARGALVLVIDDINFFVAWYKRSGLARRV